MKAEKDFLNALSKYFQEKKPFSVDIPEVQIKYFMDKIKNTLKKNESILIIGDYDVDGLCGAAGLREVFTACKKADNSDSNIEYYIPTMDSGYGLDYEMLRYLFSKYDTVITVDNGTHAKLTKQLTPEDREKLMGLDHHPYDTNIELPMGMINPNKDGSVSISSGYLVEYLLQKLRKEYQNYGEKIPENLIIDLTALSLLGDVADRSNKEVSSLIEMGLKEINKRDKGIYRYFFDDENEITVEDINFKINPLLNAPRRLGIDSTKLVEALTSRTLDAKTLNILQTMETANTVRKDATNYYFTEFADKEAKKYLEEYPDASVIVQMSNDYPIGLNGIIAAMVSQKYNIDAFICSRNVGGDNMFVGSGRGNTIKESMSRIVALGGETGLDSKLLSGGGHPVAIGGKVEDPRKLMELVNIYNQSNEPSIKAKNENIYVSRDKYSISDYKKMSREYDELTRGIPMTDNFFAEVGVFVVGPGKKEVDAMEKEGKIWMVLQLRDEKGDTLSIRTKSSDFIDYDSLNEQKISLSINPVPSDEGFEGGIFAEVKPPRENIDLKIETDIEVATSTSNTRMKK